MTEGDAGTRSATFTVSLSAPSSREVTVGWSTSSSVASVVADIVAASGVVTFAPRETTRTVTVDVLGNQTVQPSRTFTVTLANPTNATIARGTGTGTILDNDAVPSLTIDDAPMTEPNAGTQGLTFTVRLSEVSDLPVTVQFATQDDTATSPGDYAGVGGTLTFAPGETARPIVVQVQGDALVEPTERFLVLLSNPTNAVVATIVVGLDSYGVKVRPDGARAYVADFNSNTVSVIDTASNTVVATIPVGDGPYGITFLPDGSRAYVSNYDGHSVSVIDTASNTVVATIAVGNGPLDLAARADGARVFVASRGPGTISVIDTSTNTVLTTISGLSSPQGLAIWP